VSASRWAVFLDRDGVLNELVLDRASGLHESPLHPKDVKLTADAREALSILGRLDTRLVVVSNQPAAAKGTVRLEVLEAVHRAVVRALAAAELRIDMFRYCFHHPQGTDTTLRRECSCRKPSPGLILGAAAELGGVDLERSWMIGDSDADVEAGRRAGCLTVLVDEATSAHRRSGTVRPDASARSFLEAALIVRHASQKGVTLTCS
jgi:D-glycero-D-manno-heptose 1,7-bisphosphate phosphatase